jgi:DNA-directed RNA polymerase alpha subunit
MQDYLTIDQLEFNTRLHHCLVSSGYRYAWQLRRTPDHILRRIPNFGKVTLNDLRAQVPFDLRGEPPLDDDCEARRKLFNATAPIDWVDVLAGTADQGVSDA